MSGGPGRMPRWVTGAAVGVVAGAAMAAGFMALATDTRAQDPTAAPAAPSARTAPTAFAVPATGALVLVLGGDGVLLDASAIPGLAPEPAPFAARRAVASVQPLPTGGAILGVNRVGLSALVVSRAADGTETVAVTAIRGDATPFGKLSLAPSWGRGRDAIFMLYRHPLDGAEAGDAGGPAERTVFLSAGLDGFKTWEPVPSGGPTSPDAVFAVFPVSSLRWLAQSRRLSGDRVETAYASWDLPSGGAEVLERAEFEDRVQPLPSSSAPPALKAAAELPGVDFVFDARLADGSRRAYQRGGSADAEGVAHLAGGDALVVLSDGRAAFRDAGGRSRTFRLPSPVPEAAFRDAVLVDGLVVAVWEEDLFPDVGRSGLVIMKP